MYKGYKIYSISNEKVLLIGIDFTSFCKNSDLKRYEIDIYNRGFEKCSDYPIVFVTWNAFFKPIYNGRYDIKIYFEQHYPNLRETDLEPMPECFQTNDIRGIPRI